MVAFVCVTLRSPLRGRSVLLYAASSSPFVCSLVALLLSERAGVLFNALASYQVASADLRCVGAALCNELASKRDVPARAQWGMGLIDHARRVTRAELSHDLARHHRRQEFGQAQSARLPPRLQLFRAHVQPRKSVVTSTRPRLARLESSPQLRASRLLAGEYLFKMSELTSGGSCFCCKCCTLVRIRYQLGLVVCGHKDLLFSVSSHHRVCAPSCFGLVLVLGNFSGARRLQT